jgi:hypothetical protein
VKSLFGILVIFLLLGVFARKFNGWVRLLLILVIAGLVMYDSLT